MSKLKVCVVCGGKSAEHEVSLLSANSVLQNLDPERYDIHTVGISRSGQWYIYEQQAILHADDPKQVCLNPEGIPITVDLRPESSFLVAVKGDAKKRNAVRPDILFPVLHGPFGEDGTIQGLFEMANMAYVGTGVAGSAMAMDKVVTKQLLAINDLPTADFLYCVAGKNDQQAYNWDLLTSKLGSDLFVKPANLGSSVGISHVQRQDDLKSAIDLAFSYDNKILIEKAVRGREFVCGLIGNLKPEVTRPGEIITTHDFFDYNAKYIEDKALEFVVPAALAEAIQTEIQDVFARAYEALNLTGLARIDGFLEAETNRILINEANTMPGFTATSLFAKTWQAQGVSYSQLLDRIIKLGFEQHQRAQRLRC